LELKVYGYQIKRVKSILQQHSDKLEVLSINYYAALENPKQTATTVNAFLGNKYDEAAMIKEIEPALRRLVNRI